MAALATAGSVLPSTTSWPRGRTLEPMAHTAPHSGGEKVRIALAGRGGEQIGKFRNGSNGRTSGPEHRSLDQGAARRTAPIVSQAVGFRPVLTTLTSWTWSPGRVCL
jgi:hypothetical protein